MGLHLANRVLVAVALPLAFAAISSNDTSDCRHRSRFDVTAERGAIQDDEWAHVACHSVCPHQHPPEEQLSCTHGAHAYPTPTHHDSMWWVILFVALCLVSGALNRMFLPTFVPYTVALLVQAIVVGVITGLVEDSTSCPMHALQSYDRNADGFVSRAEWDDFTCVGCHPDSVCAQRSCGDGTAGTLGCSYTFEYLDSRLWKRSPMSAASFDDVVGDGKLSADELWTADCNLLADLTGAANIDPHLLLLLFLPVLLFESAFAIEMGMLRKQMWQVLLLASVGVLISSLLTAAFILAFRPEWGFKVCWMIGTILSATDPVAVVALLKDLGAPKSLGTMIEGESLLNDGSAIVLFQLLYGWVKHTSGPERPVEAIDTYPGGWVELVRIFGQMCLLGVLFGWVSARVLLALLKRVYNDALVEVSLVVAASYLTFWLAEVFLESSAVLAVVTLGFVVNLNRSAISPEVLEFLLEFYEATAFMFNTVIFYIAGFKLGLLFVDYGDVDHMQYAWAIYPVVLLTRGITIGLLLPVLRATGIGCSFKTAVAVWWAGLRCAPVRLSRAPLPCTPLLAVVMAVLALAKQHGGAGGEQAGSRRGAGGEQGGTWGYRGSRGGAGDPRVRVSRLQGLDCPRAWTRGLPHAVLTADLGRRERGEREGPPALSGHPPRHAVHHLRRRDDDGLCQRRHGERRPPNVKPQRHRRRPQVHAERGRAQAGGVHGGRARKAAGI